MFFRKQYSTSRSHPAWIIPAVMGIFVLLRIVIAILRPVAYTTNGFYDEWLMIRYANLEQMYATDNFVTLIKTLSFPWFLNLAAKMPFSFSVTLALYWSLAALAIYWLLKTAQTRPGWAVFGFVFVLFCPAAFEDLAGIRLYRTILQAPSTFIFFGLLGVGFLQAWNQKPSYGAFCLSWLVMGLFFPFAYYIKEDGDWMRYVLMVFGAVDGFGLLYQLGGKYRLGPALKKGGWKIVLLAGVCILIPFANLSYQRSKYRQANLEHFGVDAIDLRTDGGIGQFIERLYQIDSPDRTCRIWAPKDAFRKAAAVSPTLAKMEDLIAYVEGNPWILNGNPDIPGDFIGWVLLNGLNETGNYPSARQVNETFNQINAELDAAFESGQLARVQGLIQISPKAGGRKWSEIPMLFGDMLRMYSTVLFLNGYQATAAPVDHSAIPALELSQQEVDATLDWLSGRLKMDLRAPADEAASQKYIQQRQAGVILTKGLMWIYRLLTPLLFAYALWLWTCFACCLVKRKLRRPTLQKAVFWAIFLMTGASLAYCAAMIWFLQFLYLDQGQIVQDYWKLMVTYGPALYAFVYPPLLLANALGEGIHPAGTTDPDLITFILLILARIRLLFSKICPSRDHARAGKNSA